MGLDIRTPIGLLFAILGAVLAGYGLVSDQSIYQRSLGVNINLWWGVALLVFGGIMLLLGRLGSGGMRPAETVPEGQKIEEIEHRTGLESEGGRRGH